MQSTPTPSTPRQDGDLVIGPQSGWLELHLSDLWRYRDLLWMFVRRDFVAVYKQTILGPFWFFIQPLITTLMFTAVFSGVARLSTNGVPPLLFYLAGFTPWSYFATCLTKTSTTFKDNANLFGKVYFPRLITPISVAISTLIQFCIQLTLLGGLLGWYVWSGRMPAPAPLGILLGTPLLLLMLGGLGLGCGILVSSLTTKYRDLAFLVNFGVQLVMYGTPVVYPLSEVPEEYRPWIELNPMTGIVETFRCIFLGVGTFSWSMLAYGGIFTLLVLFVGVVVFNRIEKTFMDTV
jgi:lipopolysaccharide transport system permease protein